MRHARTTVALATAGAIGLAAVPVIAQEVADGSGTATATEETPPSADPSPDAAADAPGAGPTHEARPGRRGHGHGFERLGPMVDQLSDDFAEELADELGLEPDEVADAIDRVRERWADDFAATLEEHRAELADRMDERLADAVEEGALTQDQADALADLFADGERPGPGMLDDLTDEQREALDALREWAGEQFGEHGLHPGPGGPGPGGPGHGGWFHDGPDDDGDAASDAPTVQESMLQVT